MVWEGQEPCASHFPVGACFAGPGPVGCHVGQRMRGRSIRQHVCMRAPNQSLFQKLALGGFRGEHLLGQVMLSQAARSPDTRQHYHGASCPAKISPVLCSRLVSCWTTFASRTMRRNLMLSVSTSWLTLFVTLQQPRSHPQPAWPYTLMSSHQVLTISAHAAQHIQHISYLLSPDPTYL